VTGIVTTTSCQNTCPANPIQVIFQLGNKRPGEAR
jgi:hypothetical protein